MAKTNIKQEVTIMSTTSIPVPVGKETSILTVLSVSEVAEYLGVGKNRVYELLNTGKLNGFRMLF